MKPDNLSRRPRIPVIRLLVILLAVWPLSLFASGTPRSAVYIQTQDVVSNRIIVKLKPLRITTGMTTAQINTELMRPFGADTISQLQTAAGMGISESHAITGGAHILLLQGKPDRQALTRAINNIGKLGEVEYVEEDQIMTPLAVPNDTLYGTLWAMQPLSAVASPAPGATGNYGADFETAWNSKTGTGAVVAVIDTGITAHDDIVGAGGTVAPPTGNLASAGYDFITDCRKRGSCSSATADSAAYIAPSADASDLGDFVSTTDISNNSTLFPGPAANSSWHGTHVTGIIAALGNNNTGVIGGAYTAKILPVRALGKGGGYVSDISEAMLWAAGVHASISNPNPARVLNLSLGGSGSCSTTQQNAINAAVAAGAVVVVAAGNSNTDAATASPANCSSVISVAAVGRDGSRAAYSNFSSPAGNTSKPIQVTLSAQGGDTSLAPFDTGINSTINSGTTTAATASYGYKQGTSMATPHVAAAAALMLSRNASLTPVQIKTILSASATTLPSFSTTAWAPYDCATLQNCGAGILNANNALVASITPFTSATQTINFGTVTTSDPVSQSITLNNGTASAITLGATTFSGENTASFSITGNTCSGSIAAGASCQISVTFAPKAVNINSAGIFIPAQPATLGAITIGLTGVASLPATAGSALAATKSSNGNSSGGCSIMPQGSHSDFSLLLAVLVILLYSFRRHSAIGKQT